MKEKFSKLSELSKMLIIASIIGAIAMLACLLPLIFANQPGWLIGVAIGTTVEIISLFLLYKGSEVALNKLKTWLFLVFYFSRMALFLASMVVTAILQFGFPYANIAPVPAFNYALWGDIIGFAPMQIIILIVMAIKKKGPISISEKKENE